jgi:hypothetical protein
MCHSIYFLLSLSTNRAAGLRDVIMRLQCFAQPRRNDWQTAGNPQLRGNNHVARSGFGHTGFTFPLHGARGDRHQLS